MKYSKILQRLSSISVLLVFILLIQSCGKEELSVLDVPVDELQSSYYVLAPTTVEIPTDRLGELVISRSEDQMTLVDDPIFDLLEEGYTIVSDFEVKREDVIHREILAIERTEGQIIVDTKPASILKTYSRYYINSDYPTIIRARTDYDIGVMFAVGNSIINQGLAAMTDAKLIPFSVELGIALSGKLKYVAEHPHDTWVRLNLCEAGTDCELDEDEEDDNNNGVADIVEQYFQTDFTDELISTGFYSVNVKDLQFTNLSVKFGKTLGQFESKSAESAYKDIKDLSKTATDTTANAQENLHFKYFPLPAFNVGVIGFNAVSGPIATITANISVSAQAAMSGGGKVDIKLANVTETREGGANVDPTFEVTKNGAPASMSELFNGSFVNLTLAVSGSIDKKFGIAFGAAFTIGEANTAGISVGAVAEVGFYSKISGEGGFKIIDVFNQQNQRNYDVFGEMCVDFGMFYDLSLFTDANLVISSLSNELDVKLTFPKAAFGLKNLSFLSAVIPPNSQGFVPGKGICIQVPSECNTMKAAELVLGSEFMSGSSEITIDFNILFPEFPNGKFKVELKHKSGSYKFNDEEFNYAQSYTKTFPDPGQGIDLAIKDGSLMFIVEDLALGCKKEFKQSEIGVVLDCSDNNAVGFEEDLFSIDGSETILDVLDEEVTFFDRNAALSHCSELVTGLMSKTELTDLINEKCVSPQGYLVPDGFGGFEIVDQNKLAVWIPEDPTSGNNFMLVDFRYVDSEILVKSIDVSKKPSESVLAQCKCAN